MTIGIEHCIFSPGSGPVRKTGQRRRGWGAEHPGDGPCDDPGSWYISAHCL